MADRKRILGFLHFRTDLGDGTRSGVYFDSCSGNCHRSCTPSVFLKEHQFCGDTPERNEYTEDELIAYLLEEKKWCYTKKLGISFLGKEPLADPLFCYHVGEGIKRAGMDLQIWTCATCDQTAFDQVRSVTDLFVVNFFTPVPGLHRPFCGFSYNAVLERIYYLDRKAFPYRVRIPILPGINHSSPTALIAFLNSLKNMKSVILDFSHSGFSSEEIKNFRNRFLEKGIILY